MALRPKRMALFATSEQREQQDDILYESMVHEIINDNELWDEPEEVQFRTAIENVFPDTFEEYCEQGDHGCHKSVLLVAIALEYGVEIDEDVMSIAKSNVRFLEKPFEKSKFRARLEAYEPEKYRKELPRQRREMGAEETGKLQRGSVTKLGKEKIQEDRAGATATNPLVIE